MEKDIILWIFGILIAVNSTVICGGTVAYILTVQRLTKLETTLEFLGYNAAKALHSPHTPELDYLLEQYARSYEEKSYDLPYEDWDKLRKMCDEIVDDKTLAAGYRATAAIVSALCKQKTSAFRDVKQET